MNTNWTVTFNDGQIAAMRRETDEAFEHATIRRPPNKLSESEWLKVWFVGKLLTGDGLHEEVLRLEIAWSAEHDLQKVRKAHQQLAEFHEWFNTTRLEEV